jgi:hypothetical protein
MEGRARSYKRDKRKEDRKGGNFFDVKERNEGMGYKYDGQRMV